jgi:hypothetical protein
MAGEIISERRAKSNRNAGRNHRGFAGDFLRNPQKVTEEAAPGRLHAYLALAPAHRPFLAMLKKDGMVTVKSRKEIAGIPDQNFVGKSGAKTPTACRLFPLWLGPSTENPAIRHASARSASPKVPETQGQWVALDRLARSRQSRNQTGCRLLCIGLSPRTTAGNSSFVSRLALCRLTNRHNCYIRIKERCGNAICLDRVSALNWRSTGRAIRRDNESLA